MRVEGFESVILYVSDFAAAKAFYVNLLGLPILFQDEIVAVLGGDTGRIVLHRNDKGHDERGIFPVGLDAGGAALRFSVVNPDECEDEAKARGITVLWPTQDALWGRFVVVSDPDGRPVVLARMRSNSEPASVPVETHMSL
jgi:catechol 2,3-dioxygenase-like lactoylglutathione lyase family enzyme